MTRETVTQTEKRMKTTIDATRRELATIRTGRASLSILDGIEVEYFGTPTPLNQLAKLSIPEPAMITAQPFDPSIIKALETAIMKSDLGLNPSNDGKVVRIPIPPLTEERRKQLAKRAGHLAEEGRTAVRSIRRDANEEARKMEKDKTISQDDARRLTEEIQKLTDKYVGQIDELFKNKEKEILEL